MTAFFEEIAVGETLDLGEYTFTADEIVRFARKFDPQPFHLSEEAAAETHFGHLCASGWHTASIFMKLFVATHQALHRKALEEGRTPARLGPSPGFEELRWVKPVFAGDTLRYSRVVTGKTESRSRPEWGLIHSDMLAHNQDGTLVFAFKGIVFVERRKS
ncbi:MaoC family dehydratase [Roseibium marinum]|uniref:Acyl dehydratase n=1 Tax=Roseibium marinum TaxID=281252 RepID=A0A2S3UQ10_9HYPH|nr:MaoC family dehydratase [Roseibium marinum]POF29808.1 acyl dehydratase [Roseibium marinum]